MQSPVVLVTHSRALYQRLRSAAPPGSLQRVRCLGSSEPGPVARTVMVDPRAVDATCLSTLSGWRRSRAAHRVVYLAFPAPPDRLMTLPRIHPGPCLDVERAVESLKRLGSGASPAPVWDDWARILEAAGRHERARVFLGVALRASGRNVVADGAAALGVGVRQLTRLCRRWFGHPPAAIVRQARIVRTLPDLMVSELSLTKIARRHGFSSRQAMTRLFATSAGLAPREFRGAPGRNLGAPSVSAGRM
ncbi:MAG TPA: helix-turn-helix transcriptional regulator [Candidatus Polarisedimenticolia bacterium]|nr:helix-turn-helix transcriptional regulator [Candidatus Polarisedimenticolia bacterium]